MCLLLSQDSKLKTVVYVLSPNFKTTLNERTCRTFPNAFCHQLILAQSLTNSLNKLSRLKCMQAEEDNIQQHSRLFKSIPILKWHLHAMIMQLWQKMKKKKDVYCDESETRLQKVKMHKCTNVQNAQRQHSEKTWILLIHLSVEGKPFTLTHTCLKMSEHWTVSVLLLFSSFSRFTKTDAKTPPPPNYHT